MCDVVVSRGLVAILFVLYKVSIPIILCIERFIWNKSSTMEHLSVIVALISNWKSLVLKKMKFQFNFFVINVSMPSTANDHMTTICCHGAQDEANQTWIDSDTVFVSSSCSKTCIDCTFLDLSDAIPLPTPNRTKLELIFSCPQT